jgi:hypothetical protein
MQTYLKIEKNSGKVVIATEEEKKNLVSSSS